MLDDVPTIHISSFAEKSFSIPRWNRQETGSGSVDVSTVRRR